MPITISHWSDSTIYLGEIISIFIMRRKGNARTRETSHQRKGKGGGGRLLDNDIPHPLSLLSLSSPLSLFAPALYHLSIPNYQFPWAMINLIYLSIVPVDTHEFILLIHMVEIPQPIHFSRPLSSHPPPSLLFLSSPPSSHLRKSYLPLLFKKLGWQTYNFWIIPFPPLSPIPEIPLGEAGRVRGVDTDTLCLLL